MTTPGEQTSAWRVVDIVVAAVVAVIAGFAVGDAELVPTWPAHAWLITLALTSQVLGWLLITVSLPRLPAVLTSIILLVQPVTTVFLAGVLLGEAPSLEQLAGVALVITGIAIASIPLRRVRALSSALSVGLRR